MRAGFFVFLVWNAAVMPSLRRQKQRRTDQGLRRMELEELRESRFIYTANSYYKWLRFGGVDLWWVYHFSVFSLVLVSIEKIYQTRISKHESPSKILPLHVVFSTLSSLFGNVVGHDLSCLKNYLSNMQDSHNGKRDGLLRRIFRLIKQASVSVSFDRTLQVTSRHQHTCSWKKSDKFSITFCFFASHLKNLLYLS